MFKTLANQFKRGSAGTAEPSAAASPVVQAGNDAPSAAKVPGFKPKVKIITAFDRGFAAIGALCAESIAQYAGAHGFDYEIYRDVDVGRPPAWAKVHYLMAELRAGTHDYVLWIDADACFVRFDRNILDEAPDKDICLVNQMCLRTALPDYPGMYLVCERPNTGLLLVQATDWSLEFLEQVWAREDYIDSIWWEQTAFHRLMGFLFEITEGKEQNQPVPEVMAHIGWLDCAWNSVPTPANGISGVPVAINAYNPVVVHFAGMKNERRLQEMQAAVAQSAVLQRG